MNGYPRFGWVDILRFQQYNGVYTSHWVDNRQPSISLTISYSFNPAKSKYKGKTAGEDELRRL